MEFRGRILAGDRHLPVGPTRRAGARVTTGRDPVDMTLPWNGGKVVNGREQLLIGGELFELEDAHLLSRQRHGAQAGPDHISGA